MLSKTLFSRSIINKLILRMNYNPPCPQPKNVIGLNPHYDEASLNNASPHYANDIKGLQISKDGQ
jgi:hypothetical protein